MSIPADVLERLGERLYDLDARVRALERQADDQSSMRDIQTSIAMLAEACVPPQSRPFTQTQTNNDAEPGAATRAAAENKAPPARHVLSNPSFRVI